MASYLDTDDFFSYTEEDANFKTLVYKACVFFFLLLVAEDDFHLQNLLSLGSGLIH